MAKRELVVTFRLDANRYQDENGVLACQFAQQDAYEMIFQRAAANVLETLLRAAAGPSGNELHNKLFRERLEEEHRAIKVAAQTATYEIVDFVANDANVTT